MTMKKTKKIAGAVNDIAVELDHLTNLLVVYNEHRDEELHHLRTHEGQQWAA